jgi:hypothetical protein
MKALMTLAFGAMALLTANFATAAPAAANNVGVYAGSNGFVVQVGDYGGYYGYQRRYNPCRDYWYRRNHPYRCGYGGYNSGNYGYYNTYRPHRYYYNNYRYRDYDRYHRRHHWRDRDRDRW